MIDPLISSLNTIENGELEMASTFVSIVLTCREFAPFNKNGFNSYSDLKVFSSLPFAFSSHEEYSYLALYYRAGLE